MSRLFQIYAPHFTAGVVVENGRVVLGAPIVAWMSEYTWDWVLDYCRRKRWLVTEVLFDVQDSVDGHKG